jgi:hypothetical protein
MAGSYACQANVSQNQSTFLYSLLLVNLTLLADVQHLDKNTITSWKHTVCKSRRNKISVTKATHRNIGARLHQAKINPSLSPVNKHENN